MDLLVGSAHHMHVFAYMKRLSEVGPVGGSGHGRRQRRDRRDPFEPRDPQQVDEFRTNWQPSPWVFSSSRAEKGYLQEPRIAHNRALAAAGLPHITMHGLRRSFGTLAEWVEAPVGIVAQIQGHKPSAIAEKHYRVRPLDLLRRWHERIEAWMLEQGELSLAPNAPAPSAAGALSEN